MKESEWVIVDSQNKLDSLTRDFDWHDAFIRESHIASPSYHEAGSTVNAEFPACVRVIIASGKISKPALELLFCNTKALYLPFSFDLDPIGEYRDWKCIWSFNRTLSSTECEEMRYRFVDNSWVGKTLKYSSHQVFGDSSELII